MPSRINFIFEKKHGTNFYKKLNMEVNRKVFLSFLEFGSESFSNNLMLINRGGFMGVEGVAQTTQKRRAGFYVFTAELN